MLGGQVSVTVTHANTDTNRTPMVCIVVLLMNVTLVDVASSHIKSDQVFCCEKLFLQSVIF